jgi:hypothetical protein
MRKVELSERIRDHAERGWSVWRLAREHHVHRREVRQALLNAQPPSAPLNRSRPVLGPLKPVIDAILEEDWQAPRKQRHTAHRIWEWLVSEHSAEIAEATVRRYVGSRKRELYGTSAILPPRSDRPSSRRWLPASAISPQWRWPSGAPRRAGRRCPTWRCCMAWSCPWPTVGTTTACSQRRCAEMADPLLETVLKDQCRQLHLPSVSAHEEGGVCMSVLDSHRFCR